MTKIAFAKTICYDKNAIIKILLRHFQFEIYSRGDANTGAAIFEQLNEPITKTKSPIISLKNGESLVYRKLANSSRA